MPINVNIHTAGKWPWDAAKENPGAWCRITEAHYWELLGVLPPKYFPGGFAVSEPIRDVPEGTVYLCVVAKGNSYYCKATTIAEASREALLIRAA